MGMLPVRCPHSDGELRIAGVINRHIESRLKRADRFSLCKTVASVSRCRDNDYARSGQAVNLNA